MSLSDEALLEHLNKHPELRSRVEPMLLLVADQAGELQEPFDDTELAMRLGPMNWDGGRQPSVYPCLRKKNATFTKALITGTSINGPMTAAKAAPLLMPNTATATAIASSKLLLAAVKAKVVVLA